MLPYQDKFAIYQKFFTETPDESNIFMNCYSVIYFLYDIRSEIFRVHWLTLKHKEAHDRARKNVVSFLVVLVSVLFSIT